MYTKQHRIYEVNIDKMKGETDSSVIKVGDFITPYSIIRRTSRQKISMKTEYLNNTITRPSIISRHTTQ